MGEDADWLSLVQSSGDIALYSTSFTVDLEIDPGGLVDEVNYDSSITTHVYLGDQPVETHVTAIRLSIEAQPVASASTIDPIAPYNYPAGYSACAPDVPACQLTATVGEAMPSFYVTPRDIDGLALRHVLPPSVFTGNK